MRDPLDDLREPIVPIHPDPAFAAELRARIARELRTADAYPSLTPYIGVVDASRALDWYQEVFAAERRGDPIVDADGKIGHAELAIGDAVLMLGEDRKRDPWTPGSWPYSIFLRVPDADSVIVDPFGHRWIVSKAMAG
jgi:uncharacterized glyoxalase superfamily protein PhnB